MSTPQKRILDSPCPPNTEPGTLLLETNRLIIRRYFLSDVPALALAGNDKEVSRYMSENFPSPYTVSDAEGFITRIHDSKPAEYPHAAGIFLKPKTPGNSSDEPLLIGGIGIEARFDARYRTWDVGYFVTPTAWHKGFASEVLSAFIDWAFSTWPELHRIQAYVYGQNLASMSLLEKCGFIREGMSRGALEKDGQLIDEVLYGVIRDDL